MPRRYYYSRRYKVTPKKKWASNFDRILHTATAGTPSGIELALNPAQETAIPRTIKVKNFKVSLWFETENAQAAVAINMIEVYIFYQPQGYGLTNNSINEHPEWVLCHKMIGRPDFQAEVTKPYQMSSKLARNLQSGDRIQLVIVPMGTVGTQVIVRGNLFYWTCV